MAEGNDFLTGLFELKKLRFLGQLTIVVTDVYPWQLWKRTEFLWPTAEKQTWARDVIAEILGKGKEVQGGYE